MPPSFALKVATQALSGPYRGGCRALLAAALGRGSGQGRALQRGGATCVTLRPALVAV